MNRGFSQWTPEETALLINKLHAGKKPAEIAVELGRGIKGVQRRLRQLKLVSWVVKKPWAPNEDAMLIMGINQGQSTAHIGAQLNRTTAAVRNRMKLLRIEKAPIKPSCVRKVNVAFDAAITAEDLAWMERYRQQRMKRQQQLSNSDARLQL